jgi:hypothetical protein
MRGASGSVGDVYGRAAGGQANPDDGQKVVRDNLITTAKKVNECYSGFRVGVDGAVRLTEEQKHRNAARIKLMAQTLKDGRASRISGIYNQFFKKHSV